MKTLQELYDERAKLITDARAILDLAEGESRDMSQEEESRFDQMMTDADGIKKKIDTEERMAKAEDSLDQSIYERAQEHGRSHDEQRDVEQRESAAFRKYLLGGMGALDAEERQLVIAQRSDLAPEMRALTTGTDASGGYTIPEGFRQSLEDAMLAFGGMRGAASVITTDAGNALPMPTANDTSNKGAILAENAQAASDTDPSFGVVTLDAYTYTSKIVLVPVQLLQDSAFDIEAWLAGKLAERIYRATNEHFTVGDGSAKPNGIVTAAASGKVGASGQTTTVIYDDFVDLLHSVDPAYRVGAQFMFNDSTLKAIRKLKDGDGKPLWQPGVIAGEPDQILGHNYVINQDMASMAASAKSIVFGDLSKYIIRDVLGVQLVRFGERYMDYLQVGFMAFSRHDGDLLDAGVDPVKYYQNAAS